MKQRLLNILVALDCFLFCVLCLGNTYRGDTASAAAYRLERSGRIQGRIFRPLIDLIFWFDPDHCRVSYENERDRKGFLC